MQTNLYSELPGGRDDDALRSLLLSSGVTVRVALNDLVDDGEEEGGRLAAASLSASHHVPPSHDGGQAVLLDRRRGGIPRFFNVVLDQESLNG